MELLIKSKRGLNWAGLLAFFIIIGLVVAFSGIATRECSKDSQCGQDQYCGADFSCHKIPVITIQKTEVRNEYTQAAALIAVSIVIAALILKKRQ